MDKKRYLEEKVNHLIQMFPAIAVIGPRQCGKSTMVKNLRPGWKYYDLENPNDYHLITSDPVAFFSLHSDELIIDEAQQYPELFSILRGIIDDNRSKKGRFLLTGSSSPDIVKGLQESLAGRIATVEMWPFKQGELHECPVSKLYQLISEGSEIEEYLQLQPNVTIGESSRCWFFGGFPEPSIESTSYNLFYSTWMENYQRDYVNRDIRALFPRLNIHNFRRFLTLLSQFSGHQLNMSDIARALETSSVTVKDYLDIIQQTFIWRNLLPFTKNSLKKVQKAHRGFFRDQGFLHFLLRIKSIDDLLLHPVAGFSFESFAIEELIRGMQTTMATGLDFTYYRTIDKSEVDLIIEGFFGYLPVEIKLASKINKRSLKSLENFLSDTKSPYGFLVNRGQRIEKLTEKIVQIPIHFL